MHKIDREKLAEVVNMRRPCMDANEFDLLREAAENWLAITDPGFEPSEEMKEAGEGYAYGEYVENAVDGFKAMIATMIKGGGDELATDRDCAEG